MMHSSTAGNPAAGISTGHTVRSTSLQWYEYLFVAAAWCAEFVTVDPLHMRLDDRMWTKHAALMLTVPAVLLTVVAARLDAPFRRKRQGLGRVLAVAWPLLGLAAMVTGGSLYARWVLGMHSTFLNLGLYMTMTFAFAVMVAESNDPDALVGWIMGVLLAGALVMSVGLIRSFRVTQVYHEQIFLVVPLAVWFWLAPRSRVLAWSGAAFLLSMAIISQKNTSYLVGLATCGYLAFAAWLPYLNRRPGLMRAFAYYLLVVLVIAVGVVLLYIWMHRTEYLPSGNPEYREHTYRAAWERFLGSPIWGTSFTAPSVRRFSLYTIGIAGGRLPTHSDTLDLLANGGLLGMGLWALGLFRIAQLARRRLLRTGTQRHRWAAHAHALAAVSLGGVLTYSFNPVVLTPSMAYLLWGTLGTLLGLAVRAEAEVEDSKHNRGSGRPTATAAPEKGRHHAT